MHMRVELMLIIVSLKKTRDIQKVAKNPGKHMKIEKRTERWWVRGTGARVRARAGGELTEGRQRACDRATQVSH